LLANLYEQTGNFTAAAGIYEKILEKNPKAVVAANNLAFYYAAYRPTAENLDRAEKLLAPYLEKFKDEPTLMDTAAWVYYQNGKYEAALKFMQGVEDKIQSVPEALYHLAMIQMKLGRAKEARANLEKALQTEKFPGREEAAAALHKLLQ
jgi:tetratricopeptide (TPR) repeat protein